MLRITGLRKSFAGTHAVAGLSLAVQAGATVAIIGPNGAGKTTTMRIVMGIIEPDGGELRWMDRVIDSRVRKSFGYLPEERGLYSQMRVRDQIVYFARLHNMYDSEARRQANAWIDRLQLSAVANETCGELSKGNQQKVQIACAVAHDPKLLILDEPFSGLDPVNVELLCETLLALKNAGTTVLLSSHQMWHLERLSDSIAFINHGQNVLQGTMRSLRASWGRSMYRIGPASQELRLALASSAIDVKMDPSGDAIFCQFPGRSDVREALRELINQGLLTHFDEIAPSLQDIYLSAVGAK